MDKVAVVDFGSQYSHLIARRIRELGAYSELVDWKNFNRVIRGDYKAVILSGGPRSVLEPNSPRITREEIEEFISTGRKVLGICYGHQLIANLFGGKIARGVEREYGSAMFELVAESKLFEGLPKRFRVWMSHADSVAEPPSGFRLVGRTESCKVAAMESEDGMIFSVQFHPEVRHTHHGMRILDNFLKIAGVAKQWKLGDEAKRIVEEIRRKVGNSRVLIAASGGVDSTVAAKLIHMAIGDKLHLVFIDTGLMREGEPEEVVTTLKEMGFKNVHYIDAKERFLKALKGVKDPEEKRRIFSKVYAEVLQEFAEELKKRYPDLKFFAQGTIYPDRIESGRAGKGSDKIKSHHNVVMPRLNLEVIEPLAEFYKDEVRRLGKLIGVPDKVLKRKPFPGPGLLVRILGELTEEKLEICREAHKIVEEEARKLENYDEIWQIFPVVLDSKSVGVMGDARSYGYIVAIRAVLSEDGMTAEFARLPWDFLERAASRIVKEIPGVTRVVYDITHKPPATIEYE